MRVCFIIYGSIDQVTGGYAYDRRVVAALRAAGDDVQLLSLQQYSDFKRDDVLRRVLSGKPEVVVGDELCHRELAGIFRGIRAISYCGNPRPRSVLLVHHLSQWETGVPVASEGRVIKLADSIIVTSKDSAARLHAGFGVSSVVCVPGADHLPKLPRVPAPKGVLRLLYVGTWTERKGLLRLVEALRDCGEVCYELTIVGDAYRDEAYRQRVAACIDQAGLLKLRCTNLGVISDGELAEVYARHDVLVLPSVYEGYGMVLAEAARAGLRIFCGQAGGASQAVQHAERVEWIDPSNAGGLRQLLLEAIVARSHSGESGGSETVSAVEFQTWSDCVAGFRAALEKTLSR